MHHSELFALRLWTEQNDPESDDIRFKVQRVLSGEVRYTRNWAEVEAFVMQILQEERSECSPRRNRDTRGPRWAAEICDAIEV